MKTRSIVPALAAVLIAAGGSVVALSADEDIYVVPETESGWLYNLPQDEPAPDLTPMAEPDSPETNGEMNGERLRAEPESGIILLPAPAPVEEAPDLNGEMNGEAAEPIESEPMESEPMESEPGASDGVVPGWPTYPRERTGPGGADGEWQDVQTETDSEFDADMKAHNGDQTFHHKDKPDGELEYRHGEANGEWYEVETDGEDIVTPYAEEELKYEDRDGETLKYRDHNGESGWYDRDGDANGDVERNLNRTGHRWGWPGSK